MPRIVSDIVEIVVFRIAENTPEFLLLQRDSREPLYPGMWQIITGKVCEAETAVEAAERELGEETGMVSERLWSVPHITTFYDHLNDTIHLSPFFAAQVSRSAEPRLSPEHSHWVWLPHEPARLKLVWPSQRDGLDRVNDTIVKGEEAARLSILSRK